MRPNAVRGVYLPKRGDRPLRIISYKQNEDWVCHCLDYDIEVKSTRSKEAALHKVKTLICHLVEASGGLPHQESARPSPALWDRWRGVPGEG